VSRPAYEHTQAGWPIRGSFIALALGLPLLLLVPGIGGHDVPQTVVLLGSAFAALLGWTWGSLTVRIADGRLQVHFGPGWPSKTWPLEDIVGVELTRTSFADGWGVHRTRRGWLYNVSGYDAVALELRDGRTVLVGTDEPRRLRSALQRALARP
jgi:hypothetical protein